MLPHHIQRIGLVAPGLFLFLTGLGRCDEPLASRVLAHAAGLLANLKSTAYSHQTKIDEAAGVYELDCSGLAFFLLRESAPRVLLAVPVAEGKRRPRALEFYQTFAQAPTQRTKARNGWLRVERLIDAEPGDFIAWRRPVYR